MNDKFKFENYVPVFPSLLEKKWKSIKDYYIPPIILSLLCFFPLAVLFIISFSRDRKKYLEIKELLDTGKEDVLLSKVYFEKDDDILLCYLTALVDLQSAEVISILHNKLMDLYAPSTFDQKVYFNDKKFRFRYVI